MQQVLRVWRLFNNCCDLLSIRYLIRFATRCNPDVGLTNKLWFAFDSLFDKICNKIPLQILLIHNNLTALSETQNLIKPKSCLWKGRLFLCSVLQTFPKFRTLEKLKMKALFLYFVMRGCLMNKLKVVYILKKCNYFQFSDQSILIRNYCAIRKVFPGLARLCQASFYRIKMNVMDQVGEVRARGDLLAFVGVHEKAAFALVLLVEGFWVWVK